MSDSFQPPGESPGGTPPLAFAVVNGAAVPDLALALVSLLTLETRASSRG